MAVHQLVLYRCSLHFEREKFYFYEVLPVDGFSRREEKVTVGGGYIGRTSFEYSTVLQQYIMYLTEPILFFLFIYSKIVGNLLIHMIFYNFRSDKGLRA